jgi:hypothetical protein
MSNENTEIEFVDGLIVKPPRAGAPDFIKASLSMRREALITWLQSHDGEWVNVDVKESRGGKWYAAVDTWKPKDKGQDAPAPAKHADVSNGFADDEIPF